MKEKLFYFDTVNHKTTLNRSYAIHLLKKNHVISVYRSKSIDNSDVFDYCSFWIDFWNWKL